MKYECKKNGVLICTVDTDNIKNPVKFDDKRFPTFKDLEIIPIKKKEIKKSEVSKDGFDQ